MESHKSFPFYDEHYQYQKLSDDKSIDEDRNSTYSILSSVSSSSSSASLISICENDDQENLENILAVFLEKF